MEIFATVILFILIGTMIMVNVFYRQANKMNKEKNYVLPELGFRDHGAEFQVAMKHLINHLEQSYPKHYPEWIKERVIREQHINVTEWENRWFEWQRFLVMAALLKSVPMYSHEVDSIWHEMLMFTREYEQFSDRYLKTALHHTPHVTVHPDQNSAPKPTDEETPKEQRAWFDLIYLFLFEPTPYSVNVLGPFLRNALSSEVIHDFKNLTPQALKEKYFHTNVISNFSFMEDVVDMIISHIQEMLTNISNHVDKHGVNIQKFRNMALSKGEHPLWNHLIGTLFLAMYHRGRFKELNQKWYKLKI